MTDFAYTELVNAPLADIVSAQLGTNNAINDNDIGKAVKMGTSDNYVLAGDGDEIEGFINSVEPITVNTSKSFGSVQKNKRIIAEVGNVAGAGAYGGNLAVLDEVVAFTQAAAGTANGKGTLVVQKGVAAAFVAGVSWAQKVPMTHVWRVIKIVTGNGQADGDTVLIERV